MKSKLLKEAIRWNTGREYTENGQRIAAAPFRGGTLMVDADRGLEYWYPVEKPEDLLDGESKQGAVDWKRRIMDAYDNLQDELPPHLGREVGGPCTMWEEYRALTKSLEGFARELPEGQYPNNPNQKG